MDTRLALLTFVLASCSGGETTKPEVPGTGDPSPGKVVGAEKPAVATATACLADNSWITSPNPPSEIGNGVPIGDETNCQFYQFSWQWFLQEVSPSTSSPGDRNFETLRVFQPNVPKQCSLPAARGKAAAANALLVRVAQVADNSLDPVSTAEFEQFQADHFSLYDQNKNVVLYNMWYSDAMCSPTPAGFPAGSMEIKTAWRQLTASDDAATYYTMQVTDTHVSPTPITLGLVGMHLVNSTANHPEFVWASFEHSTNAPNCDGTPTTPTAGWSFANADAAKCLATGGIAGCTQYAFNAGGPQDGDQNPYTGTPTNVCQLYPHGNDTGDTAANGNNNKTNLSNITELNAQMGNFLRALPATDPMAVWTNYTLVGGLWTNGGVPVCTGNPSVCTNPVPSSKAPASTTNPERGSLQLTNVTMETFEQGPTSSVPNCFSCHQYAVTDPAAQTNALNVSHLACALLGPDSGASVDCPKTQVPTAAHAPTTLQNAAPVK